MIDEKKLIERFRASLNTGREEFPVDLIIECIEEHPKVGEWIPLKDRMPECTRKTTDGLSSSDVVLVTTVDDSGFITSSVDFLIGDMWAAKMPNEKVIAWQPLPEPYRPKGE